MARPITVKKIIQHIDCFCGSTVRTEVNLKQPEYYLKKIGYKKLVEPHTGEPYFFRYFKSKFCPWVLLTAINHKIAFSQLYPLDKPLPAKDPAPVKDVMTDLF